MIKDGHLFVDAGTTGYRQSTIWLDRELSETLLLNAMFTSFHPLINVGRL